MSDNKTPRTVDRLIDLYLANIEANQHIRRLEAQIIQLRYRQDIHDNLIKRMQQEGKPEQGVDDIVNKHFWDLTWSYPEHTWRLGPEDETFRSIVRFLEKVVDIW